MTLLFRNVIFPVDAANHAGHLALVLKPTAGNRRAGKTRRSTTGQVAASYGRRMPGTVYTSK